MVRIPAYRLLKEAVNVGRRSVVSPAHHSRAVKNLARSSTQARIKPVSNIYKFLSSRLSIFPLAVLGICSTNATPPLSFL